MTCELRMESKVSVINFIYYMNKQNFIFQNVNIHTLDSFMLGQDLKYEHSVDSTTELEI